MIQALAAKHVDVAIWIMTICTLIDTAMSLIEKF